MTRRVGVIGTFVWDTVHAWGAGSEPVEQWGGVAYSLNAFAGACPPDWEVVPIAHVGEDLLPAAEELVRNLPRLTPLPGRLAAVPEPNNRVELHYLTPSDRTETLTGGVPPWSWADLAPCLEGLDALFINYLSGMEMPLEVAEQVRAHFAGPIYADFHSLFLGEPSDRPREPRSLPDADRWLRTADVIQMNREEFALLARGLEGVASAGDLLADGPGTLLITAGAEGAEAWTRVEQPLDRADVGGEVRWMRVGLAGEPGEGDPTGCGDVWGATMFCSMLRGAPLVDAMQRANAAAAAKVRHGSIDGLAGVVRSALQAVDPASRVP